MSVMNGFRSELINKIVGFNAHVTVKPYENKIDLNKSNQSLQSISENLILSNSGEAIIIKSNISKGILIRGYQSKDFSKLKFLKMIHLQVTMKDYLIIIFLLEKN